MKYLIFFFVSLLALSLQTTIFARLPLLDAVPDLILIISVCWSFLEGMVPGVIVAFMGGLVLDIFFAKIIGVQIFIKMLIAFLIGLVEPKIFKENPFVAIAGVAVATVVDWFLSWGIYQMFGLVNVKLISNMSLLGGEVLYNAIFAPLFYFIMYKWLLKDKN